jgi:uncharacterized protein (TIGR01244 family)
MENVMKINDQITVGPQPSKEEIYEFGREGFKTVINFRTEHEENQPVSPAAEGEAVTAADMTYLHVPVSMNNMDEERVDQFRKKLDDLPKPVFAHCKSGKRAGAMVMMDMAVEQGMSGEQTLKKAEEMGFECDKPELKELVKNYVDHHTK